MKAYDYLALALILAALLTQSVQPARYFLRLKPRRPAPQAPVPQPTFWKVTNSPTLPKGHNFVTYPRYPPVNLIG